MPSSTAAVLLTCDEDLLKDSSPVVIRLLCDDAKKRMQALLDNRPADWESTTADPEDRSSVQRFTKNSLVFRVEVKIDFDVLDTKGTESFISQVEDKTRIMVDCVRAGYGIVTNSILYSDE